MRKTTNGSNWTSWRQANSYFTNRAVNIIEGWTQNDQSRGHTKLYMTHKRDDWGIQLTSSQNGLDYWSNGVHITPGISHTNHPIGISQRYGVQNDLLTLYHVGTNDSIYRYFFQDDVSWSQYNDKRTPKSITVPEKLGFEDYLFYISPDGDLFYFGYTFENGAKEIYLNGKSLL